MKTKRLSWGLVLGSLCCIWLAASSFSQEPDKGKAQPGATEQKTEPAKKDAPANKGKVVALVGGDVYTITREVIRGGTVLVQDGKILRVGQGIAVPEGATVLDAKGKHVLPGFVAVSMTGVGVRAPGGGPGGPGGGGPGGGRGGKVSDTLDPFDRDIKFCLGVGITTGCVDVSGGFGGRGFRSEGDETQVCPCCGLAILPTEPLTPPLPTAPTPRRHAVLKMSYGELEPMLVKEEPFYHLPGSGLAGAMNHFNWREQLRQARKYLEEQAEHEKAVKAGKTSRPPRQTVPDQILQLVKKEIALRTDASSVDQMRAMIRLAKEFDYKLILDNVHEAWLMAEELAESKASVVFTPRNRRRPAPGREDSSGSSIETSLHLEKAGVPFALSTQMRSVSLDGVDAGRDLTGLALEAAFAVRGGCSEKTALAALTIVPARILGLDSRIGSIEEGKDADLLILDGPPLDYRTYVQTALVGGKVYYERNQDRVYPTFERAGR